ncbi:MAG: ribulose-phosphate 3-epimerase [Chlorobi bacterium]|nr:ribulose-phosphate 3-epimerase [Chlorobiota bacterium]
MKKLAPSILSADFTNLASQIEPIEKGGADIIHCDIMDGRFVPNITFGPFIVEAVRRISDMPIDVHLMIKEPDRFIHDFANAGADYISVHREEVVHLDRTISFIKSLNVKAGVVINPATPVATLDDILSAVDFVLVMSVNPGFGGQKFISYTLDKIKNLNSIRNEKNLDFLIEIDGGINLQNAAEVAKAGCDIFVAGSSVFRSDDIAQTCLKFKSILNAD